MKKEKQVLTSPIIEISSVDNVTKEITMLVHKIDIANANGLDFKESYTETYMQSLINKPVVTKYCSDSDDLGTHEQVLDSDGNIIGLETIAIGTIKEVWIDTLTDDDTVKALYAKADLWNYKYPEIVACVEKLFNNGVADSSVEVEIYEYEENPTQEYRVAKSYTYLGNCLLGEYINPADNDAGVIAIAQREIANAIKTDLENIKKKGETELSNTEVFNKGYETKYHGKFEVSSITFSDVRSQIYNLLNPVNAKNGNRDYNYYIREMYVDYVVVEDWYSDEDLYKIPYTVTNNQVVLSPSDQWQKGKLGFIPDGVDVSSLQSQITELNNQITKIKEEAELLMSKTVEELQTELSAKEVEIAEFKKKVDELNETIVSQETIKKTFEDQITELNSTIEELNQYKEKVEVAEKEAKLVELSSRYEKLLSEETFKTTEVQEALQSLDAQKLNEIVVNEVAKTKVTTEVNATNNKDIIINAKQGEDLISKTILQKYGIKA